MDPVELLKDDHARIRSLFDEYERAGEDAAKRGIVDQILMQLEVHAAIEEEIYYPAVKDAADEEMKGEVEHGEEEHVEGEKLMADVRRSLSSLSNMDEKVRKLRDTMLHHIEEEESKLLPASERLIPKDRRMLLGDEMAGRKAELAEEVVKEEGKPATSSSRR